MSVIILEADGILRECKAIHHCSRLSQTQTALTGTEKYSYTNLPFVRVTIGAPPPHTHTEILAIRPGKNEDKNEYTQFNKK